jgi:DNA-binding NarL/FixJ family response regulator
MNILLVDDHPLTVSVYATIISEEKNFFKNARITIAHDCNEAFEVILNATNKNEAFDLAIIDYNLPPYKEEKILSGADLAILVAKNFPKCKTAIITSHYEILIIYDLLRRVNPQGLISKNDINTDNLCDMIKEIMNGASYKSPQIQACIKEVWTKDLIFDDYNRKILLYLSKGYRIKELERVIMLSGSAIQKRIVKLKKVFKAQDERELLKKIFEQGFL